MEKLFDRIKELVESREELKEELAEISDLSPFMRNLAENIIDQLNNRILELREEIEAGDPFLQYLEENAHRINPSAHLGDTQ